MNTPKPVALEPVTSSQIAAIGHDSETNTLAIQFLSKSGPGSVYHYQNFTEDLFEAFKNSESVGKHFYAHIKPFAETYPYAKVEVPIEIQAVATDASDAQVAEEVDQSDSEATAEAADIADQPL